MSAHFARAVSESEPVSIFGQFLVFLLCWIGLVLLIAPEFSTGSVRIVYNASDSAPRGLYLIERTLPLRVGDLVVVRLRGEAAALAARRNYLPAGIPVIKPVAAVAPQLVCSDGHSVRIDGESAAATLAADMRGNPLISWQGCRHLVDSEMFLLSAHPGSYDSRYFGPVDALQVIGRARPLLNRSGS